MRISDWSSDVCSSYLRDDECGHFALAELPEGFEAALSANKIVERPVVAVTAGHGDRTFEADFGDILDDPLEHLLVAHARIDDGDPVNREIGRASGRERVW